MWVTHQSNKFHQSVSLSYTTKRQTEFKLHSPVLRGYNLSPGALKGVTEAGLYLKTRRLVEHCQITENLKVEAKRQSNLQQLIYCSSLRISEKESVFISDSESKEVCDPVRATEQTPPKSF